MEINWFSILGLILDIIGAWLLYKYGMPSNAYNRPLTRKEKENEKNTSSMFSDAPPWESIVGDLDVLHKSKVETRSKLGMMLVIIGFILQLTGTVFSPFISKPEANHNSYNQTEH